MAGDEEADEEEEEESMTSASERRDGDDKSSHAGNNDEVESHEIEVPAEDFYMNEELDHEFLASLHAFPLKELKGAAEATAPSAKTTVGKPHERTIVAAGAVTRRPGAAPNQTNAKYRFQHTGKT